MQQQKLAGLYMVAQTPLIVLETLTTLLLKMQVHKLTQTLNTMALRYTLLEVAQVLTT